MIHSIRSLVRPVVTVSLVLSFIAATFMNTTAAALLQDLTLAAFAFWFGGRSNSLEQKQ